MGQALLTKKVGDKIEVPAPKGMLKFKVLSIKFEYIALCDLFANANVREGKRGISVHSARRSCLRKLEFFVSDLAEFKFEFPHVSWMDAQ